MAFEELDLVGHDLFEVGVEVGLEVGAVVGEHFTFGDVGHDFLGFGVRGDVVVFGQL